ncbi:MAG: hypothetical protein C4519_00895 [Desulfobacteraceae bacterium]|nr:MAG: hypothetical protein C4519_00895 [Desulfobacteraceae bacterium]
MGERNAAANDHRDAFPSRSLGTREAGRIRELVRPLPWQKRFIWVHRQALRLTAVELLAPRRSVGERNAAANDHRDAFPSWSLGTRGAGRIRELVRPLPWQK